MTTEQKIREAFAKEVWADTVWEGCGPTALDIYTAGYLALLNELDHYDRGYFRSDIPLYRLPEGVEKP